ncbi:MAG: calcium-binding protein [Thermoguttaceae bacterium]
MSPLEVGDMVEVTDTAPAEDCASEIFVYIVWNGKKLAVPLEQLEPMDGDDAAVQAIADWLYWCLMGYEF